MPTPKNDVTTPPPCGGSGVPDKPATGGLRYNTGKAKWSLIDFESLEGMVRVMEYGANKYAAHNWKKGMSHTEISECLMRHLFSYLACDDFDVESKQHHIDHVLANAMFLKYNIKHHPHLDDRYKESFKTPEKQGIKKVKPVVKILKWLLEKLS
jgi:hypothetical protein